MLKIITYHTFQAYGIYRVYINILNWMTNQIFELITDTGLLPFLFILSVWNVYLRQQDTTPQQRISSSK